ncbi:hypothetical protein [Ureibacillus chungkukjangi]|uniref:hypothetical protein n=1 Tax=Ureibacillus chungkukjangi TaxID=1202712 RepID=UPI00203B9C50|nr:hypothetical protein [Ureibacillus chungkukjangi]
MNILKEKRIKPMEREKSKGLTIDVESHKLDLENIDLTTSLGINMRIIGRTIDATKISVEKEENEKN